MGSLDTTEVVMDITMVGLGRPVAEDFNCVVWDSLLEMVEVTPMQKE